MNRVPLKASFLIPAIAVVFVCACGKGTINGSKESRMVGKWIQVQFATDDNNNGVLDSWEVRTVGLHSTDVLVFNKDSTGYESVHVEDTSLNYPFTWVYLSGDSIQRNGIGHDTITYQITKITSTNLTLMNYASTGMVWYMFNKE